MEALASAGISIGATHQDVGTERVGLKALQQALRKGDVLVVSRLDRLGMTVQELSAFVQDLISRGIVLCSLGEAVDTSTDSGRRLLPHLDMLAEMARTILRERVKGGLETARQVGRQGGRPPAMTHEKTAEARQCLAEGMGLRETARKFGIDPRTLGRHLKHMPDPSR